MTNIASRRCFAQCLGLLLGVCSLVPGALAQRTALSMRVPALPAGATDLGALPASQPVAVTLYLAPSAARQAALVSYLTAVQTPGNAAYRVWLTPTEFGQEFGATADQVAEVNAFVGGAGLSVESASASGLRVTVSGTEAQIEAAFAPVMHRLSVGTQTFYANTQAVSLPASVAANVLAVGGLSDLPDMEPMTVGGDSGAGVVAPDALQAIGSLVDAGAARVMTLQSTGCLEDFGAASRSALELALQQANAEGITVLATTGCGARGSAGFPSILSEATSVAVAPGITPPVGANLTELRPGWQLAQGLPADGLRDEPDVTVSSLSAMAQAMMSILAQQPVAADGSAARLGNVNATLYELGAEPGLYTQPDSAPNGNAAVGTWEAATGLGLVDLKVLEQDYPHGSLSDNVSINVSNGGYVAHGQSLTFSSSVTDTSGQGNGVAPSGTVTFSTNTGVALGSATLAAGAGQVSYNQLDAGNYTVTAAYSGDGTYATGQSVATQFAVGAEAAQVTASSASCSVGGTCAITVTVKSTSGVGTPSGTVTVAPQGTSDHTSYTGTLSGSGGTATAVVAVAAVQGGGDVFQTNCTTGTDFTCYNPQNVTAQVSLGTSTMTVTANPVSPTAGQTDTITATVSGKGGVYPTPQGNVDFYDNGSDLGPATLSNGTASYTTQALTGSSHSFSAKYDGDNNYGTVTAQAGGSNSAASATTLQLTVSPNPPVAGGSTSLTAAIGYALTNGAAPTGTVNFYEDGSLLSSVAVSGGQAVYSSTGLSGTTQHQFYAVYNGDTNYQSSTSSTVTTAASGSVATTTTMTVTPNPPVYANATTLSATVAPASGGGTPTGTVSFYEDGALFITETLSGGVASYVGAGFSGSSAHTFYAVYNGDTTYKTSTSPTVNTAASGGSTTTTALTVSPNPPVSGSATTLTATITYTLTNTAPSGTVMFYEDNAVLGTGAVSNGTAMLSSSALSSATTHEFYAVYSGDTNYKTSVSPGVATSASSATNATTTTLAVSPNPPVTGGTTSLTASIGYTATGVAPTGNVEFYEDGNALTVEPVQGGTATLSSGFYTTAGASHSFFAIYLGDSNFKTSTSATVTATSAASSVTTTTALTVSPNPPVSGKTTTLTAAISQTGSTSSPTGTVSFYQDSSLLGTTAVSGSSASYSSTAISGTTAHSFDAVYSGDSSFKSSTSAAVTSAASTTTATTTITVSAASASVALGGTDVLTGTIMPSSIVNSTAPTGTITFSSAQGTLCIATVSSNAGSCTATLTTGGTQAISAAYSGDANYAASTSAVTANVSVGATSSGGVLTVSASPSTGVMYGNTITLTSTLTPTTAVTGGPAGSVTFSFAGTTPVTYTAALVSNGTTSATATYAIPTPAPGAYIVTATCASTNVTCTSLTASASVSVIKGNTTTTLTASPTSPLAGQSTMFTAMVTPASTTLNAAAIAPTGTVTFYINGVANMATLNNGVATYSTVLTATTGNFVTAVYSGDTNWNGSNSSQLNVMIAAIPTTGTLTANETTALYTANIVLTDNVLVAPTALTPDPASPAGTVTYYDLYNGQTTLLGTASLTQIALGDSVAQFSTTGLLEGTHTITALFNANTSYAASTATLVVNITDYGVTYSPQTLTLTPGASGASIATITPYNGFGGQVVLSCTPPAGTGITCSITPAVVDVSGTAVLTVQTTAATAKLSRPEMGRGATAISLAAVSLGTLLLGLMLPRRRRLPILLLLVLAAAVVGGSIGCTTQGILNTGSTSGSGGSNQGGTPLGTQLVAITTQGTDGVTTVRHNTQVQVTVQ
jgi:hypothetical protein